MIKTIDADYVGQFPILSGMMRVTDPCYRRDSWCTDIVDNVKKGAWDAYIKTDPDSHRVSELMAFHKDVDGKTVKNASWTSREQIIGVDSGQCGFFDDKYYPENTGDYEDENSFYYKCCSATERDCGLVNYGVVSRSGYGDGSYGCFILEDKDENVIGVKVVFIEECEDDDDEGFDYSIDYDYNDD